MIPQNIDASADKKEIQRGRVLYGLAVAGVLTLGLVLVGQSSDAHRRLCGSCWSSTEQNDDTRGRSVPHSKRSSFEGAIVDWTHEHFKARLKPLMDNIKGGITTEGIFRKSAEKEHENILSQWVCRPADEEELSLNRYQIKYSFNITTDSFMNNEQILMASCTVLKNFFGYMKLKLFSESRCKDEMTLEILDEENSYLAYILKNNEDVRLFEWLLDFLGHVVINKEHNLMDADNLASMFNLNLFHNDVLVYDKKQIQMQARLLSNAIRTYNNIVEEQWWLCTRKEGAYSQYTMPKQVTKSDLIRKANDVSQNRSEFRQAMVCKAPKGEFPVVGDGKHGGGYRTIATHPELNDHLTPLY